MWLGVADIIKFNDYYYESMTEAQRTKTSLHEIGHALGLDEFTDLESTRNVMHQGIRSTTKLGPADIGVYRKKW